MIHPRNHEQTVSHEIACGVRRRLTAAAPIGGAVLTGSQVYGEPRPDSDVDLVVLADEVTQVKLAKLLTGAEQPPPSSGPRGGISLKVEHVSREGDGVRVRILNLIFTSKPEEVEAWREGTADLAERAPVTREDAVAHLREVVGDGHPGSKA